MKRAAIPFATILVCLVGAALIAVPGAAEDDVRREETRVESCASCHETQCDAFARNGHAAAGKSLKGEAREDPACLSCHAPQQDLAQGVSCTSCHGTGFSCGDWNRAVAHGRRMPAEESCRACHRASTQHPDLAFQFQIDYPVVAHESDEPEDLFALEGIYRRFETYGVADGLPHSKVFAVKVEGNDVWAGTEDGIARLRGGKWESWSVAEGLVHRAVTSLDCDPRTGEVFTGKTAYVDCILSYMRRFWPEQLPVETRSSSSAV